MRRAAIPKMTYVTCAHPECKAEGRFQYDNQKDAVRIRREQSGRWRCDEHFNMAARLLPSCPERVTRLVAGPSSRYPNLDALFWGDGSGYVSGPGFEARTKDWPAGAILEVTARVILPAPCSTEGQPK